MIPLGGNTIFVERRLLKRVGGWDERCLTEDADLGVRLSAVGERIRVVYDPRHVTREETPDSLDSFIRQRTRWNQGFLQVLRKGDWRRLPRRSQRLLAVYTLAYPLVQALMFLLWPLSLAGLLALKLPMAITLPSLSPLYLLLFQLLINLLGLWEFTRLYGLRFPLLAPARMALAFVPFNLALAVGAVRAVIREVKGQANWEKTAHIGAHRQTTPAIGVSRIARPARGAAERVREPVEVGVDD
jgi:cellulose synthase/poly-beta-1,6-N-acetylglucosamine synthase-like glycosyltransferase